MSEPDGTGPDAGDTYTAGSNTSSGSDSSSAPTVSTDSEASPGALEDDGGSPSLTDRTGIALERVRTDRRPHAAAVVVAVGLGLALSWLHWMGLVLGGALVALVASTPWRGVAGAVGFGALALVVFAVSLGSSTGAVLEMTPIVYVTVASGIGLPLLGSLLRGIA